jgi:hypothetical protein
MVLQIKDFPCHKTMAMNFKMLTIPTYQYLAGISFGANNNNKLIGAMCNK